MPVRAPCGGVAGNINKQAAHHGGINSADRADMLTQLFYPAQSDLPTDLTKIKKPLIYSGFFLHKL
jgi:hypothetical protein